MRWPASASSTAAAGGGSRPRREHPVPRDEGRTAGLELVDPTQQPEHRRDRGRVLPGREVDALGRAQVRHVAAELEGQLLGLTRHVGFALVHRTQPRGPGDRRQVAALAGGALPNVTCHDHNQVMNKVGIADLKAHLSQHLRTVRGGRTLTVLDRNTPIARIVPVDIEAPLEMRRATRKASSLPLPPPCPAPTDSLSLLLRDRETR